jgi:hypothetical protein
MKLNWKLQFLAVRLLVVLSLTACARQSEPFNPGEKISQDALVFLASGTVPGKKLLDDSPKIISTVQESPGVFITQVRSISYDIWTDVNLSSQSLRSGSGPFDIGFQRYKVRSNSGVTNSSGLGGVCKSNTSSFPASGITATGLNCGTSQFISDVAGQAEVVGGGGASFNGSQVMTDLNNGWFIYNIPSLTPNFTVFVVKSGDGAKYYAIQVIDYYSEAGTSGYPKFRWREINP